MVSSSPHHWVLPHLESRGARELFEDFICHGDAPNAKPAPDLFLHAAAAFDIPPEDVAVVEDSAPGVTAGVAAWMRVFGYAHDSGKAPLVAAGATATFLRMTDLPGLLGLT